MADLVLPIMAPSTGVFGAGLGLGCWAHADELPLWMSGHHPWLTACNADPVSDLGLCDHHLLALFPPEVRSDAPHATQP